MPITLNGSGTVSGISAGGLPDGIIQSADLATAVTGKILQVTTNTDKTDTLFSILYISSNMYDVTGFICSNLHQLLGSNNQLLLLFNL